MHVPQQGKRLLDSQYPFTITFTKDIKLDCQNRTQFAPQMYKEASWSDDNGCSKPALK